MEPAMFDQRDTVVLSPQAAAELLRRKRIKALGQVLASALFGLGALWLLVTASSDKERWMGGGWLLFCAACLAITWRDWRALCDLCALSASSTASAASGPNAQSPKA